MVAQLAPADPGKQPMPVPVVSVPVSPLGDVAAGLPESETPLMRRVLVVLEERCSATEAVLRQQLSELDAALREHVDGQRLAMAELGGRLSRAEAEIGERQARLDTELQEQRTMSTEQIAPAMAEILHEERLRLDGALDAAQRRLRGELEASFQETIGKMMTQEASLRDAALERHRREMAEQLARLQPAQERGPQAHERSRAEAPGWWIPPSQDLRLDVARVPRVEQEEVQTPPSLIAERVVESQDEEPVESEVLDCPLSTPSLPSLPEWAYDYGVSRLESSKPSDAGASPEPEAELGATQDALLRSCDASLDAELLCAELPKGSLLAGHIRKAAARYEPGISSRQTLPARLQPFAAGALSQIFLAPREPGTWNLDPHSAAAANAIQRSVSTSWLPRGDVAAGPVLAAPLCHERSPVRSASSGALPRARTPPAPGATAACGSFTAPVMHAHTGSPSRSPVAVSRLLTAPAAHSPCTPARALSGSPASVARSLGGGSLQAPAATPFHVLGGSHSVPVPTAPLLAGRRVGGGSFTAPAGERQASPSAGGQVPAASPVAGRRVVGGSLTAPARERQTSPSAGSQVALGPPLGSRRMGGSLTAPAKEPQAQAPTPMPRPGARKQTQGGSCTAPSGGVRSTSPAIYPYDGRPPREGGTSTSAATPPVQRRGTSPKQGSPRQGGAAPQVAGYSRLVDPLFQDGAASATAGPAAASRTVSPALVPEGGQRPPLLSGAVRGLPDRQASWSGSLSVSSGFSSRAISPLTGRAGQLSPPCPTAGAHAARLAVAQVAEAPRLFAYAASKPGILVPSTTSGLGRPMTRAPVWTAGGHG